jgi:hypothetical protein
VEVDVWDGLMGRHPVVLPDRDSRGIIRARDQSNGTGHAGNECRSLSRAEIQDRFTVRDRDDQEVPPAALLTRYERSGEVFPLENREATPASEVIAKRAGIGNRDVQGHRDMMPGLPPGGLPRVSAGIRSPH